VPNWREKIADTLFLEKFNTPEKFKVVLDLARSRWYSWRDRVKAIRMLGYLKTPQAEELLLRMFQNPFFHCNCPALKYYMAESLGEFEPTTRLLEILKEGLKDFEVLVREATAKSLGRLKMQESVTYLIEAFNEEKSLAVKIAIVNALKSIASTEAQEFLRKIASDEKHRELKDVFGDSL
jgi:HEAT repeat protein